VQGEERWGDRLRITVRSKSSGIDAGMASVWCHRRRPSTQAIPLARTLLQTRGRGL
jgi:hypothetical protein